MIPRVYARRPGRHTKRRSVHNNYSLLHQKLELINICIETEYRRSRRKNHDDEEEDYYSAEDTEENILTTDATPSTPPPMTSDALEEQRRILNFPTDSEAVVRVVFEIGIRALIPQEKIQRSNTGTSHSLYT